MQGFDLFRWSMQALVPLAVHYAMGTKKSRVPYVL